MTKREAWVRYPPNVNGTYPETIKHVYILDFVSQHAYHNPEAPNYDVSGEIFAICIDQDTGKYSQESLYWLYDWNGAWKPKEDIEDLSF